MSDTFDHYGDAFYNNLDLDELANDDAIAGISSEPDKSDSEEIEYPF